MNSSQQWQIVVKFNIPLFRYFYNLTTSSSLFLTFKYTNITPPANSKANRGRWCEDGLRFITIVEVIHLSNYTKTIIIRLRLVNIGEYSSRGMFNKIHFTFGE